MDPIELLSAKLLALATTGTKHPAGNFVSGSVLAWLMGSIPCSLLIARYAKGIDLRQHGSGNIGATNVARVLGWKWGFLAFLFDALKGALPVLLIPKLLPVGDELVVHQKVVCGALAMLGHMAPPWLRFRGGKGVATGLGVAAVLSPWASGAALLTFIVIVGVTRIVSMASMVAVLTFAITQVILWGPELFSSRYWSLGLFSLLAPLGIIFRHRTNLVRLWRGEERRIDDRSEDKAAK
ncbi:glycerol-3-phosphate 1-O-acyltransferase PlsY [Planctomicrobium sp. SH664]|uniref:glycerol-3-phosphate 1-O-acyltransferase PlsY n=1 Tax=Planctomicrobium sp. SH664 TaxID=3448125 RepID=UPI003F5C76E6